MPDRLPGTCDMIVDCGFPVDPEVVRDLRDRDERDRNRADSPLKPAADAVILDSTHLTLEQVVAEAERIVLKRL